MALMATLTCPPTQFDLGNGIETSLEALEELGQVVAPEVGI